MRERFVILGNGIAGVSAAQAVREQLPEAKIWIVSEEKGPAYRKPLLSKTYLKSLKRENIQVVEADWYEREHIRLVQGRKITGIEADKRAVRLSDGQEIGYDACIYALGAVNVLPPFCGRARAAGADGKGAGQESLLAGVSTIRTMEDVRRLKKRLILSERAVVIGGGSIGLEIAWEMEQMGCQVTVLEGAPWLMGRLLDEESAGVLAGHIERQGIRVCTGVQVESLTGERSVTGVRLADGRHFPADLVVVCCGTRAETGPAREGGIACERGVLVDDFMETDRQDIYGAGDCIQWRGEVTGLWGFAQASGRLAGYNAAIPKNKRKQLTPARYPVLFNGMGLSLFAMGDLQTGEGRHRGPEGCGEGQWQGQASAASGRFLVNHHYGEDIRYEKYLYQEGKLTGAVLIGDLSRMEEIRAMLSTSVQR